MVFPQIVTERPLPGGGTTTLGGGTAISGGGTPDTGGGMPFRPIPAEFNHCRLLPSFRWYLLTNNGGMMAYGVGVGTE